MIAAVIRWSVTNRILVVLAALALAGPGGKASVPGAGNAAEPLADPGAAERGRWLGRLFWIAFAYVPETESQVTPSGALHA